MKTFKRALSVLLVVCMLLSCIPAMSVAAAGTAGTTAIQDLEVDQRTTPMGIDNTTPEFRWEMTSDVRGQKQTAYQIVVKNGDTTVWDSGKVESDVSNAIPYEGKALESSTRYTWTVTVWDKDGKELDSQSSWFEMGLLNQAEDWAGASFIAPSSEGVVDPLATDQYTIDLDFVVVNDNMGFCFNMSDTSNFIMWQINTYDSTSGQVLLRPHFMSGGNWRGYPGQAGYNVKAVDITSAFGVSAASEIIGKEYHLRLVVSGNQIKTYIGAAGTTAATPVSELKLADDYTYSGATSLPFRGVGFRHNSDGNAQEVAKYDNIVCVDNKTGETLYSNDFEAGTIDFSGNYLELKDGWLQVGTLSTTGGEVRTVATKKDAGTSAPMFRKEFEVKEGLVSARLYATSLGIYEAYVNGKKAGVDKMAPGWTDYKKYVQYQTYDITDMLTVGQNAIGAVVGNGWYSGYVSVSGNNQYGTDEAFIGQIVLTYANGDVVKIGTDATWKSYVDGPYVETDNQNGETYDATKEVPGWDQPNFDESKWLNTKIATSSTIKVDSDMHPESVALVAQPEEPAQEIEYLKATFLAKTGDDTYVYDLGQNISGVIRINVKGEAGTVMKLRYGEMVYKNTNALYTANLRSAKATDYYTLKGDENGETYQPALTFHGFRYFEVSGLGYQPAEDDVIGVVIHSKLDRTGYVETNNELVNKLFSNIIWGHRDNYLSVPTDCPQRDERMGWTGDASVFSRTASLNFDIDAFYTKYIRDVYAASKNGNMPSIAPIEPHPGFVQGASVWGDFAVIGPWTVYSTYGDTAILEEAWPYMTAWISYYENTKAGSDYICDFDTYGDWLAIGESTDALYSSTCFYAYITGLMTKMATALGKTEEADYYAKLEQNIKNAIVNKWVNQDTGIISNNTQTTYVLALAFDILPTEQLRQKAADNLVARIEAKGWHLSGGFIGIENLLPVLTKYGYNEVAYKLLLTESYPSWLYSVVNGATTMWERWNSYVAETDTFGDVSMNSFNHYSFGSVGAWMYQYAGGIQYDWQNPGYKHFTIAPNPSNQLNQFKTEYESVYGRIVSDWTLDGEAYKLNVTVPANTTATVVIPSDVESALTVDGQAVTAAVEGVKYAGTENGKATFEVESGSYAFASTISTRVGVSASTDDSIEGKTLVTMKINGEEANYVTLTKGEQATVEAVPVNSEWAFVSWSGDVESTENPVTVTADQDMKLVATFRYVGLNNLAEGKSVTVSSNDGGAPTWGASNLTDGLYIHTSTKNGWTTRGLDKDNCNVNVQIDLGAANTVSEVHLYPRTDSLTADGKPAGFPRDFTVSVSTDGSSWTEVAKVTDAEIPAVGVPYVVSFDEASARYVKINFTKSYDHAADDTLDRVQLAEIGIYNANASEEYTLEINGNGTIKVNGAVVELPYSKAFKADSDVTVEAVSDSGRTFESWSGSVSSTNAKQVLLMNSNKSLTAKFVTPAEVNLALKKPVSSNTTLESGNSWGARLLTDGLLQGTGYSSNDTSLKKEGAPDCNIWIDIDLEEAKLLDTIVLYPRNTPAETAAGKTPSYPRDFTFQVSNDGKTWTTAKAVTDERTPDAGEAMTYELDAPVVGRYVRLHVTKAGLVEDSDLYYRVQLQEEQIFNRHYTLDVSFTNAAELDEGAELQTVLNAILAEGLTTDLTGSGLKITYTSSDEKVATVDENGKITALAAGETEITAAVTVNGYTFEAKQTVKVNAVVKEVEMLVSGDAQITLDKDEVSFTVSAKNTEKLATAILELTVDTETMSDPTVEAVNGWYIIGQTYANGKLKVVLGNNAGVTSEEASDMLKLTAKLTGKTGSASVEITSAKLSVYTDASEAYVPAKLGDGAKVVTEVTYNKYDVNHDGVVDQLDLTRTQRFYGSEKGEDRYNATCDVNGDGIIDINDLILIVNNYTVEL